MANQKKGTYPFTNTANIDVALNEYKQIHANLVGQALEDFNDTNDPSGAFRKSAIESMKLVEGAGAHDSDKTSAMYAIFLYTLKLCESALRQRGLSMESRAVYETMAFTYSSAFSYGW